RELELLRHTWGEPEQNEKTGLPAYGWFDAILGALPAIASLAGTASNLYGQTQAPQAGVRNQTTGNYDMFTPTDVGGGGSSSGSNVGALNDWRNWSDFLSTALGTVGALTASNQGRKQQKRLQQQQAQQYQDYMGPHVDYAFNNPTTETIGLSP